ncbi:hypothetical protein CAEBREN_19837 [Caenorhabditis brenneri]|uniref:Uncharacterized protein n=1 Tax=Caenorhabditis brenneri TaxID=135651 RepID=G0N2B3_CAEBE|nr:hypothetical protein CAEBREN_19837 [Caenorhabditis brenneri]
MSACDNKSTAFKDLAMQGIASAVPKFSKAHVKKVEGQEVELEIAVREMEPRIEGGYGVTLPSLGMVGQMTCKASWRCQNPSGEIPMMQQSAFSCIENPKIDDVLYITGKSIPTGQMMHHLQFQVHTIREEKEVSICHGSSSLFVLPKPAVATGLPTPPATPSASQPLRSTIQKSPSRAVPYVVPDKRKTHNEEHTDQHAQFMLVNATSIKSREYQELIGMMQTAGVVPKIISHKPLPIKIPHRFVFYFTVLDDDASKIESMIEGGSWAEKFNPDLLKIAGKGFIAKAMSLEEIVEAMILSTMIARDSGEDPSIIPLKSDIQEFLRNKDHIRKALKMKGVKKHVRKVLSKRGTAILDRMMKEYGKEHND